MKRENRWERFFGLTMNIHPIFNIIGMIGLSIKKRSKFSLIKTDKINLYFWIGLVFTGIISIVSAYNRVTAISSSLIPFLFIWMYILGRWYIENPVRLLEDILKGTAFMGLISIIFKFFHINIVINGIELITDFHRTGRGYILGVEDNGLGVLFQVGVVGALGLLVFQKGKKAKIYNLIYFFLSLGGLIITNSRGAMVGSATGITFLALVFSWKILVFFTGVTGISILFSSRLLRRVKSIVSLETNYERLLIWRGTLNMIKDHLWFGIGPGNFGAVYEKYRLPEELKHARSPHSNYLNIVSGWGIIGGFLFFGWIFFIMIRSWLRGADKYQKVIIAILAAFWAHVFFNDLIAVYSGVLLGCLDNDYFSQINRS